MNSQQGKGAFPAFKHLFILSPSSCGCPGTHSKAIHREVADCQTETVQSRLSQWPVQIKLAPVSAPYFDGANLLIAADCTAFAYRNFHNEFIRNHIKLIGCSKLDKEDYADLLHLVPMGI